MMLNSNAQTSNSLGQCRNSRCGSDRYRDIRLTEGDFGLHELDTEKSAEVIVVDRKRADKDSRRAHKSTKDNVK